MTALVAYSIEYEIVEIQVTCRLHSKLQSYIIIIIKLVIRPGSPPCLGHWANLPGTGFFVSFYESDSFCSSFKHRLIFFAKHIKFITVCIFGFKIKVKVEKKNRPEMMLDGRFLMRLYDLYISIWPDAMPTVQLEELASVIA
jgi:hypothetical protein